MLQPCCLALTFRPACCKIYPLLALALAILILATVMRHDMRLESPCVQARSRNQTPEIQNSKSSQHNLNSSVEGMLLRKPELPRTLLRPVEFYSLPVELEHKTLPRGRWRLCELYTCSYWPVRHLGFLEGVGL